MSLYKNSLLAPILTEIHKSCFEQSWTTDEFEKLLILPTTRLWIKKEGFLLCSEVAEEMEILTICVLPNFRLKHIAQDLLEELFQYAQEKKIKHIFLEVAEDNIPAQKLYLKTGFTQINKRKNYYTRSNGKVDALCMIKKMSDDL